MITQRHIMVFAYISDYISAIVKKTKVMTAPLALITRWAAAPGCDSTR